MFFSEGFKKYFSTKWYFSTLDFEKVHGNKKWSFIENGFLTVSNAFLHWMIFINSRFSKKLSFYNTRPPGFL